MPFASHDGVRLYWRADGAAEAPVILLLNAIGADLGLWDLVAPSLARRYRVLRMDTRGHGASDAPTGDYRLETLAGDALAVLDAAGASRAALCGLSLGAMTAMTLALAAPQRVVALICACSSAQMDPAIWRSRIETVRAHGVARIVEPAIERFFSPAFARSHGAVVGSARAALLATSAAGYAGCAAAIRDMQLSGRLAAISAPTLVISGAQDIATPHADHGAAIVAAIAGARTASLAGGHLLCLEAPSAFCGLVLDFLADLEAGPALRSAGESLYAAGITIRREVLGDAWVDRALAGRTAFNADFQTMITRYAWGEVWGRAGLDQRTRRLLVIAITATQGRWEEFRLHVRAGLQQGGFTQDELKEVLMQLAVYAGAPAANTAFAEAGAVIGEIGAPS